jgi:hypothetical protein
VKKAGMIWRTRSPIAPGAGLFRVLFAMPLKVEIGPVQGSFPGMLRKRAYEVRLPADWPPASVTVNGLSLKRAGPLGKNGWSFEGDTLTTVIPVQSASVATKVTIEVRRAQGMLARRGELDGFAGTMTRLRGAYDAMGDTEPAGDPPDILVDAVQSGDRLGYHPENAAEEIAHFHKVLPEAQAAVTDIGATFAEHAEERIKLYSPLRWVPGALDVAALKKSRIAAMSRAEALMMDAGK